MTKATIPAEGKSRPVVPPSVEQKPQEPEKQPGSRTGMELPRRLHMLDAESLTELWTAPAVNEAADFFADEVYSLESGDGGESLVARRAKDGTVRWRSPPLARQILRIDAGGPLVFCGFLGGTLVVERPEGRLLGEAEGSYSAPVVEGNRLYASGNRALLCASFD